MLTEAHLILTMAAVVGAVPGLGDVGAADLGETEAKGGATTNIVTGPTDDESKLVAPVTPEGK